MICQFAMSNPAVSRILMTILEETYKYLCVVGVLGNFIYGGIEGYNNIKEMRLEQKKHQVYKKEYDRALEKLNKKRESKKQKKNVEDCALILELLRAMKFKRLMIQNGHDPESLL